MLLAGYEFKNMNKDQVYDYLNKNNIYYDQDSNIYEDLDCYMYQLPLKIYDNELQIIETRIDENVLLITYLYKFKHQTDKSKKH